MKTLTPSSITGRYLKAKLVVRQLLDALVHLDRFVDHSEPDHGDERWHIRISEINTSLNELRKDYPDLFDSFQPTTPTQTKTD